MAKKANILMVEDNPGDVALIKSALTKTDFIDSIHHANDGAKGIAFLKKEGEHSGAPTPDMVLLDLNLPKKHGLDVLRVMRESEGLRNVPVMVLTSSDNPKEMDEAYSLSATLFLTKPAEVEELDLFAECLERYWTNYLAVE